MNTTPTIASTLKKGDMITDGTTIGTIVTNPHTPKRRPGHITFDVRAKNTIYVVTIPDTSRIQRLNQPK